MIEQPEQNPAPPQAPQPQQPTAPQQPGPGTPIPAVKIKDVLPADQLAVLEGMYGAL